MEYMDAYDAELFHWILMRERERITQRGPLSESQCERLDAIDAQLQDLDRFLDAA